VETVVPRTPEAPTPDDILEVMDACEPYSAGELAAKLGDTSKPTIYRRLETLHERGRVNKKMAGGSAVYWID